MLGQPAQLCQRLFTEISAVVGVDTHRSVNLRIQVGQGDGLPAVDQIDAGVDDHAHTVRLCPFQHGGPVRIKLLHVQMAVAVDQRRNSHLRSNKEVVAHRIGFRVSFERRCIQLFSDIRCLLILSHSAAVRKCVRHQKGELPEREIGRRSRSYRPASFWPSARIAATFSLRVVSV